MNSDLVLLAAEAGYRSALRKARRAYHGVKREREKSLQDAMTARLIAERDLPKANQ